MNQRAVAAVVAIPLVAAMAVVALFKPLPYTTYAPVRPSTSSEPRTARRSSSFPAARRPTATTASCG